MIDKYERSSAQLTTIKIDGIKMQTSYINRLVLVARGLLLFWLLRYSKKITR